MSMNCDIILKWSATPGQLAAVGSALWRWCNRTAGAAGIYRYLDNQALADLIAGKLPDSSQTAWRADSRGVHFSFQGEASHDREATIRSLRQEISTQGGRGHCGRWQELEPDRLMVILPTSLAGRGWSCGSRDSLTRGEYELTDMDPYSGACIKCGAAA